MRVVGGSARGRRLRAPAGRAVRPTSDRVREAVFDVLGSLGGLEGSSVLDLFAGTGALGIEARSRGAARVTFVEHDRAALEVLRQNLAETGLEDGCEVVRCEVLDWLRRHPDPRRRGSLPAFDVALCDPPYDFASWPGLMGALDARLAVLEARHPVPAQPGWDVVKTKRYGGTVVTLMRRASRYPGEGRA